MGHEGQSLWVKGGLTPQGAGWHSQGPADVTSASSSPGALLCVSQRCYSLELAAHARAWGTPHWSGARDCSVHPLHRCPSRPMDSPCPAPMGRKLHLLLPLKGDSGCGLLPWILMRPRRQPQATGDSGWPSKGLEARLWR